MKCPSVACLWPSSPPSHLITSALPLPSPPSLYTGASDGSIIFWSLHDPNRIRLLSVLCGHSSPVAALSLAGASSDGVLCAWAPPSLRCRRRLPPWAGSPALIRSAPDRHVCVACAGDRDVSAVLLVDSVSLNVVRTIAHGAIGIGMASSMVLVGKDAILVDRRGKVRFLKLEKDSGTQDAAEAVPYSSIIIGDDSTNEARAVAISQDGKLLALIFETRSVFKLVADGAKIGELAYENSVHPIGGVFLQDDELVTVEKFVVWTSNGAAVVYSMLSLDGVFRFEALCEIPAVEHPLDGRSAIRFCQFK